MLMIFVQFLNKYTGLWIANVLLDTNVHIDLSVLFIVASYFSSNTEHAKFVGLILLFSSSFGLLVNLKTISTIVCESSQFLATQIV